jgi:hypothetical protein
VPLLLLEGIEARSYILRCVSKQSCHKFDLLVSVSDFSIHILDSLDPGLEGVQEADIGRGTLCEYADRGEKGGLDWREVGRQLLRVASTCQEDEADGEYDCDDGTDHFVWYDRGLAVHICRVSLLVDVAQLVFAVGLDDPGGGEISFYGRIFGFVLIQSGSFDLINFKFNCVF